MSSRLTQSRKACSETPSSRACAGTLLSLVRTSLTAPARKVSGYGGFVLAIGGHLLQT
jgi:hypothetical protein